MEEQRPAAGSQYPSQSEVQVEEEAAGCKPKIKHLSPGAQEARRVSQALWGSVCPQDV